MTQGRPLPYTGFFSREGKTKICNEEHIKAEIWKGHMRCRGSKRCSPNSMGPRGNVQEAGYLKSRSWVKKRLGTPGLNYSLTPSNQQWLGIHVAEGLRIEGAEFMMTTNKFGVKGQQHQSTKVLCPCEL
ncbi:hypothetical protein HOLleu_13351 [Holothuria leucospilota]|uniref:Uncharacterized protein n=1 Tax=Holothuria leucospilota TaxID=206669 RepID=A0A9Q1HAT4_HOLLE|nr:hypothetical protein HOLleu_13351 [Holothuria leucospilota]